MFRTLSLTLSSTVLTAPCGGMPIGVVRPISKMLRHNARFVPQSTALRHGPGSAHSYRKYTNLKLDSDSTKLRSPSHLFPMTSSQLLLLEQAVDGNLAVLRAILASKKSLSEFLQQENTGAAFRIAQLEPSLFQAAQQIAYEYPDRDESDQERARIVADLIELPSDDLSTTDGSDSESAPDQLESDLIKGSYAMLKSRKSRVLPRTHAESDGTFAEAQESSPSQLAGPESSVAVSENQNQKFTLNQAQLSLVRAEAGSDAEYHRALSSRKDFKNLLLGSSTQLGYRIALLDQDLYDACVTNDLHVSKGGNSFRKAGAVKMSRLMEILELPGW